ncbi:MAG: pyrroline-5-carboxylate reductase [Woeseiaceae bacterium]
MSNTTIGFIGGGNMTLAIAGGLLASNYPAEHLCISEPSAEQRERLANILPGVDISADNKAIAGNVDCLVLATKPQVLADVCREMVNIVQGRKPLVVSIAAGVRGADIDAWLGGGLAVVRVMPNQPALLRMGASGLFANSMASDDDRELASSVMAAVGNIVWVESETDIDSVTAISGSGPAYFFLLIDMLAKTAVEMGLDENAGRELAVQTALGAAAMAEQTEDSMDDLIARVRSPGGTTAAALDSLDAQNVRAIFSAALTAARDRARQLADEAGD